jgi:starch phosphorylase
VISDALGSEDFLLNLDLLTGLRSQADNPEFQEKWMEAKMIKKQFLTDWLLQNMGIRVNPNALFDIQIKRIHEYKRQLLNILRCVTVYKDLQRRSLTGNFEGVQPRVVLFAGKAAPAYQRAKLIIKLINAVGEKVNNDPSTNEYLKVIFVPNYNVSLAEKIVPANDISQHISTAGTEASGTSNMKFALNGGLIVGTLDGANIEIRDAIGHDNMFIFGLTADKIDKKRQELSTHHTIENPRLLEAINSIRSGEFGEASIFDPICDSLIPSRDFYLLGADFESYMKAHQEVDKLFSDKAKWAKMSILSTAGMGKFSSDRSIHEYASQIWGVEACRFAFLGTDDHNYVCSSPGHVHAADHQRHEHDQEN